jgi:hypothetical protein
VGLVDFKRVSKDVRLSDEKLAAAFYIYEELPYFLER